MSGLSPIEPEPRGDPSFAVERSSTSAALPCVTGPLHLRWYDARLPEVIFSAPGWENVVYRKALIHLPVPGDPEAVSVIQVFAPLDSTAPVDWLAEAVASGIDLGEFMAGLVVQMVLPPNPSR